MKTKSTLHKPTALFGLLLMLSLWGNMAWGQTTIASDGLNNSSALFTLSGGAYYTGNSASGDRPASSPFASEGTHSRGFSGTTGNATLTSSNINTSSYTSIYMTLRLASFSIGSTGNGADVGDIVTIEVSPNGGTNYYSTVRVKGASAGNAYWSYIGGTGNASTAYDGNATPVDFQPAGGGNRTTDGYSTITVTGLPATANLKFKITLLNNSTKERWVVDDFLVKGTAAATPSVAITDNGTQIAAADVNQGTTAHILNKVQLAVTTADATLTGMTCTTTGSYAVSDISNMKVRYSADATLDAGDATLSTITPTTSGTQTFSGFTSQTIASGTTGYIFITADIAGNATHNNTIAVSALADGDFTFTSATISGTRTGGGTQTIKDVTNPTATLFNPADDATGVTINSNLVITFSENVKVGTAGNITIKRTSDNVVFETIPYNDARISFSTNTVTINPTGTFTGSTEYYVLIDNTVIRDNANLAYAGISSTTAWSFTTQVIAPEINIKQNVTNIPTSGNYNFGNVEWGSVSDVVFTIENTGTADLTLGSATISGSAYTLLANYTSPVAASGTTTFTIRFTPNATGAFSGSISIPTNDSDENPYVVNFTGNGTANNNADIVNIFSNGEPDNIAYASYQEANLTGTSLEVGRFSIRDGGASGTDADNLGTTLTDITVSLSNSSNVRRVALYDGTTELGTEQAGAGSITFSGLSLLAADNSTKQFSIRASFNSTVTDNQQIQFTVTSATADGAGSTFAAADAGGAVTSVTGDDNRIEVTASAIIFDQGVSNTSVGVAMSPAPSLQAVDDNLNIDLDYAEAFTVSISTGSTTFDGSATTTGNFVNGVATLSNLVFATAANDNKITVTSNTYSDISGFFNVTNFVYAAGDYRPTVDYTDFSYNNTAGTTDKWEYYDGSTWGTTPGDKAPQNATARPTRVIVNKLGITAGGNSSHLYNDIIILSGGELILNDWAATPSTAFIASGKKLEVQSGGKLYVQGNFDMNGSGQANLIVRSGGTMIINEPNMDNNQEMWEGIENFESGSYVEYQDWHWTASSTVASLVNITATITNNSQGYKFGYFTLNTTTLGSTHWTLVGGSVGVINLAYNDITINTNGTGYVGGASNKTGTNGFVINGNLIINQGNFCFGSSYSTDAFSHQLTVNGNFEFNSTGTLKIHRNNAVADAVSGYVNLKGNIKIVSGATISNDNATDGTKMKLNFAGSGTTQTVDIVPVVTNVPVYVKSPAVVALTGTHLQMDANSPLTIESGGKLNINAGKWATILGTLTNNAGAGGLVIKSDATGTGSLINSTSGVAATYERYLTGGTNVWHDIFSPLSSASLPTGNVYSYDESKPDVWNMTTNFGWNGTNFVANNSYIGWQTASGSFGTSGGYIFNNESTTTATLTGGNLEVSDKTFNVTYNTHTGTIPTSGNDPNGVSYSGCVNNWNDYDGWIFVGNPYASALDWSAAYTGDADIESGIYIWDDGGKNYKYFLDPDGSNSTFSLAISVNGDANTKYIPSGQGFFVKSAVASGSFTIPATARTHTTHTFWKRNEQTLPNLLKLNIAKDNFTDEIVLFSVNGATDDFDGSFDLHKLFSLDGTVPQIYSMNYLGGQFALNSFPEITGHKIVTLGVYTGSAGEYTINFTENSFEGVHILLEDKLLVDTIAIETNPAYTFSVSEAGLNTDRFVLHFNANNAPQANGTIENQQTNEDETYQFKSTVEFTDPDFGDNVTVTAECPTWLVFDPATKTFSGTPTNSEVGNYTIKLIGTDLMNAKTEVAFNLEVVNTNDAPELLVPLTDQTAKAGVEFNFMLPENTFGDIDAGDILNFSAQLENGNALPVWLSFNTSTKVFSGTPSEPETLNVEVLASDLSNSSASDVFEITVSSASSVEQNAEKLLSIYPNPCRDFVTIQKKGISGSAQIVIRNMMGVPLYFGQIEETTLQIDMSSYTSGVYFIEITTEQHTQNYKLLIE